MTMRTVDLALIDAGGRLRALDPAWVDFLAEEIGRDGLVEPIRVVARGERFRLVSGARRVAACLKLGHANILAIVVPQEALADDAAVRLGEIQGNLSRGEATVLERAYYVDAWREIYLSAHALPKRGRKPESAGIEIPVQRNNISGEGAEPANDDAEDPFVLSLSEAARQALGISQPTMSRYLRIARIEPAQGHRLVGHPSADSRGELLMLAEQDAERQREIVDLLRCEPPKAATVAEAIAQLNGVVPTPRATPSEQVHQRFSRLRPQDQFAFLDLNTEVVERWQVVRSTAGRRSGGRGAA
ncbi:ParB N-terminal domain-containing protein [Methylobacterium aquaticum]|uniref:ParB N-terminal domain-containing protein n=1 Tax=Methylobacterium aquaticum TaxID=270351 RepID=UPI003D17F9A2